MDKTHGKTVAVVRSHEEELYDNRDTVENAYQIDDDDVDDIAVSAAIQALLSHNYVPSSRTIHNAVCGSVLIIALALSSILPVALPVILIQPVTLCKPMLAPNPNPNLSNAVPRAARPGLREPPKPGQLANP